MVQDIARLLRESIEYALAHRQEALDYALNYARDLDPGLADQFVGMYVNQWTVDLRANGNGAASKVTCKRLVVATGAQTQLPDALASPKLSSAVMSMDRSKELIERVHNATKPLNIAIIGADQEAVELFEHLIAAPGNHRATMILPGSALRVEDGTPL